MSEEQAVVPWEERLKEEARAVAQVERPAAGAISLRSGIMTYMDQPVPNNELDCVVLATVAENVYYDTAWDPDTIVPPACFALAMPENAGKNGEEMIPHEVVQPPQSPDCASCEQFKWGTAMRNGKYTKGKACSHRRRLAIMPLDALKDETSILKAEIARMSLPVTSVKNWRSHANLVAAQYNRPPWAVITRIKVKPDPKTQFQVVFSAEQPIANDLLDPLHKAVQEATKLLLEPYDMTPPEEREEEQKPASNRKKK
jgi:hypothetical protein